MNSTNIINLILTIIIAILGGYLADKKESSCCIYVRSLIFGRYF